MYIVHSGLLAYAAMLSFSSIPPAASAPQEHNATLLGRMVMNDNDDHDQRLEIFMVIFIAFFRAVGFQYNQYTLSLEHTPALLRITIKRWQWW